MAKRAFNLGEELRRSGVPTVDTREQIEYIELDHIDPDPENFYSLDGIDELAGSIELVGLQQPLRVRDGEYGHVIVVSGHRRRAACMLIRDGGSDMFKGGVPCIRERPAALPEMQELKLIFGNAQTRVLSAPELSRQAVKTRDLIAKLRSKGFEFQGRTRELVATVLQTSDSRIGRLTAIREKLVPELLSKFDEGLINETAAYRMTQETADVQSQIWRSCGISLFGISVESVELVIGQIKRKSAEQAPAAESSVASPQVSAEKAPADPVSSRRAETASPENKPHVEDGLQQYLEARHKEDAQFWELMQQDAADSFILRSFRSGAAPLRKDNIDMLRIDSRNSSKWTDTEHWTATNKGLAIGPGEKISRTWTEVYDAIAAIAISRWRQVLVDKGNQKPASHLKDATAAAILQWQTGDPAETAVGWYAVRVQPGGLTMTMRRYLWWSGGRFTRGPESSVPIIHSGDRVLGWLRLPEEE